MTETNKHPKLICLSEDEKEEEEEEESSKMYQLFVENDIQDVMNEKKLLKFVAPFTKEHNRIMKSINPSRLKNERIDDINEAFQSFQKYEIKYFDIKSVFAKNFSVSKHLMNSFFKLLQLRDKELSRNNKILSGCDLMVIKDNYSKILMNIRCVIYIPFIFRYDCIILYYIVIYCVILKL